MIVSLKISVSDQQLRFVKSWCQIKFFVKQFWYKLSSDFYQICFLQIFFQFPPIPGAFCIVCELVSPGGHLLAFRWAPARRGREVAGPALLGGQASSWRLFWANFSGGCCCPRVFHDFFILFSFLFFFFSG